MPKPTYYLSGLPYNVQIEILLNLNTSDIQTLQTVLSHTWTEACESIVIWRHQLSQSTRTAIILDSDSMRSLRQVQQTDAMADRSQSAKVAYLTNMQKLLERKIQDHFIDIHQFKNDNRDPSNAATILGYFLWLKDKLWGESTPAVQAEESKIIMFGPDLSQTWLEAGRRPDIIAAVGSTFGGGFRLKFQKGRARTPFVLHPLFRTSRQLGRYDATLVEYLPSDWCVAKIRECNRILLCIRNILPYAKTQDFEEIRAQLVAYLNIIREQRVLEHPEPMAIKVGILLTNYTEKEVKLRPWGAFETLQLEKLEDDMRESGVLVEWKILQIDFFDPHTDSHDAVDVFYQWLVEQY